MRDRLPKRISKALMPAARALFPEGPEIVLKSQGEFEAAAAKAVLGEAGSLELSYELADSLAGAALELGFGPSDDTPRPFTRVWLTSAAGERHEGVVLRCEHDEIAVLCPPTPRSARPSRAEIRLGYRGVKRPIEIDLHVNDAVGLAEALVLHLTRPGGRGGIGWDRLRVHASPFGGVRAAGDVAAPGEEETDLDIALQDLDRWMSLLNAPRKMRPDPSVLAEEVARCIERVELLRSVDG